jgi:uncharacterized protein
MSTQTPHDLHSEFPEHGDALHSLKVANAHFRQLASEHETLNKEIHRIEIEQEPASDDRLEGLKKRRLALLDDIALMIRTHEADA